MSDLSPQHVRQIVGRDDATILEIGANDGEDSEQFARLFPTGRTHCFEPDQRAIAKWHDRMAWAGDDHILLYEIAVSDHTGQAMFHPSDGTPTDPWIQNYGPSWDKSGSLLPNDQHTRHVPWLRFADPITVPCITLDDWAATHCPTGDIHFAWVDVQGAEAIVLRGATQTLPRIRWWYCECHRFPYYQGQATLTELDSLLVGFERVGQFGENVLYCNRRAFP